VFQGLPQVLDLKQIADVSFRAVRDVAILLPLSGHEFSTHPPRSMVTSTLRDDAEERVEHPVEVLGNVFPEEPQNQYSVFLKQAVPALIAPVLQRGVDEAAAVAPRGVDRTGALDGDCVNTEQDDEVTKDAIRISTA
jgi:hypothetical protein